MVGDVDRRQRFEFELGTCCETPASRSMSWANVTDDAGVQLRMLAAGTGAHVDGAKRVKLAYTGKRESSGDVFDSTSGYGVWLDLAPGKLVEGFRSGVLKLRVGDKADIRMTGAYGYGVEPAGSSAAAVSAAAGGDGPPLGTLIFTVEVMDIDAGKPEGSVKSGVDMDKRSEALAEAAAKRAAEQAEREARKAAAAARGAALAAKAGGKGKKR